MNLLSMIRDELRSLGIKVSHRGAKKQLPENIEQLMVFLPLGRAIHVYLVKGKLLLCNTQHHRSARYFMDIANPKYNPKDVVDMFRELAKTYLKFIKRFEISK